MNVLDKAKELGQLITETPEYKQLKVAEAAHLSGELSTEKYRETAETFGAMMEQINAVIVHFMKGETACGGGCGGCCGCK